MIRWEEIAPSEQTRGKAAWYIAAAAAVTVVAFAAHRRLSHDGRGDLERRVDGSVPQGLDRGTCYEEGFLDAPYDTLPGVPDEVRLEAASVSRGRRTYERPAALRHPSYAAL